MIGLRAKSPAQGDSRPEDNLDGTFDVDFKLGDLLRGERATLGKSLLDVQRELRIRASYVAAIENCDISAFDTPSFIAGYVRSYARYLHLDPDETFLRFCRESGFQPTHGMAPAASGPKPQRRPSDPVEALANPKALFIPQPESFWSSIEPRAIGSVMVLVALIGGLGFGGYSVLQEVQKVNLTPGDRAPVTAMLDPVQEVPAVSDDAGTEIAMDLPQPEALDRIYRPQSLDVPVLTPRDGPIAAIDPGLTSADDIRTALAAAQENPSAADPMQGPAAPVAVAAGETVDQPGVRTLSADAPEVELLAARPAWVRVTSADGTVLLEKTMDAGERFTLPKLEQPPLLRTGNSGAVYFAVNGQTYGPAAPGPQVVKNVELSAAALTAKYVVADLSKDAELANMVALAVNDAAGTSVPAPRPAQY